MAVLVIQMTVTPVHFAMAVTIDPVAIFESVGTMIAAHATRYAEGGEDCAQCNYAAECIHLLLPLRVVMVIMPVGRGSK
jgi:hypothetical protein